MIANFIYKTKGLDKFTKAAIQYAGVYKTILPDTGGPHTVNVYLEKFKNGDHIMLARNASTIWVSPDYDKYPTNFIGAAIGHELVHIKDHLNEHIDILANKRHLHESEREAYAWMISNARHFNLSLELKREILRLSEKYNR